MWTLKISIDLSKEFSPYFDENYHSSMPRELADKLKDICNKFRWKYELSSNIFTVWYPGEGDDVTVFDYLSFSKILEEHGILLKQDIFPKEDFISDVQYKGISK